MHVTICPRHGIREILFLIIGGCKHENRDVISLGPESARIRSRCGDSPF
jgi:hypothetical protein